MEVIRCDLSLGKTLDMTPKLQMKKLKIDKKGYIEFLIEKVVELIYFIWFGSISIYIINENFALYSFIPSPPLLLSQYIFKTCVPINIDL